MKPWTLQILAAVMSALPCAASAVPVLWAVAGQVENVAGKTFDPSIAGGSAFQVLLGFDTEAPLRPGSADPTNPGCPAAGPFNPCPDPGGGGGFMYLHDPHSVTMAISFGGLGPYAFDLSDWRNHGSFSVRDNYMAPGHGPLVDGLSFSLTDTTSGPVGTGISLWLEFGGTNTSLLDIPAYGIPPASPPGLADLEVARLRVCFFTGYEGESACQRGSIGGSVTGDFNARVMSVTAFGQPAIVPEPATGALMSLGLACLAGAGWRRRSPPAARR